MTLKIAILEDNDERRTAMCARLGERFPQYEICCFTAAKPMIGWLSVHLSESLAISLDHDLEVVCEAGAQSVDPGTGRDVADYLAAKSPQCHVVIHSTNVPAAIAMECELQEAGWKTTRVTPYNDLEWIGREWFAAIRDAVIRFPDARAEHAGKHSLDPLDELDRLCEEEPIDCGGVKYTRDQLHERR